MRCSKRATLMSKTSTTLHPSKRAPELSGLFTINQTVPGMDFLILIKNGCDNSDRNGSALH